MLFLAKILAIVVLIWFYTSAQTHKQPPIKWAIIGFLGYVLAWCLGYVFIHIVLPVGVSRSMTMGFLTMQIPALSGALAAYFIRGKLIADVANNPENVEIKTE